MNTTKTALSSLLALVVSATAGDLAALCSDRAAIERVYYNHRLGQKPAFEQSMPRALIERLVKEEQHKEGVVRQVYGVKVEAGMVEAEVQRIGATTRAPEILAELKDALGNDASRFACVVARPIVVERLLRQRFEDDATLHSAPRHQ